MSARRGLESVILLLASAGLLLGLVARASGADTFAAASSGLDGCRGPRALGVVGGADRVASASWEWTLSLS